MKFPAIPSSSKGKDRATLRTRALESTLELTENEKEAFPMVYPFWDQIPHLIRPSEDEVRLLIADYLTERRILDHPQDLQPAEKKWFPHSDTPDVLPPELRERIEIKQFHRAMLRYQLAGCNPTQDFSEFGLNEETYNDPHYLAENIALALPLVADCFHTTYMNHERFLPRHYEKLILRIIFSLDQELVHSIPFLKRDSMANYTCALLNFLPAGSTSTDILLEPLKYLKSIADKTSNTYFVVDAVRGRLKKKALLVSEKSISRMMKSIATRVQMIHRERCLLVPYPRNKTLYLIYCRDLYGNNVSVHYPQFHSKCYATHEMIREAIFSKRVKFYKDNDQLFDLMGGSKMKVPSFEVIKRAIVSEELSMPTSYDLLVLQLMAIEYDQRSEKGVPRTSIPYEYVAACKRLFNESWVDAKIGRKFYRMLNGYRNNMGDGDIYDDTYNVFAFENDFSMAY